jgi:hypothetical protein
VDILIKLGRIDRRILYLVMAVLLLYPLVRPLGLPVSVSSWTQQAFDSVDALKPGDKVVIDFYYTPAGMADIHPQTVAVFEHLMQKGVKVICVAFYEQGVGLADNLIREHEAKGRVYGEDFVHLGFMAGIETAMSAFVNDIPRAVPRDYRGNRIEDLPIMQGVKDLSDVQMLLYFTSTLTPEIWVRQAEPFGIPIVAGVITVMGPQAEPFLHSGQLAGLMVGMRHGAEYEVLSENPGPAVAPMDAQSIAHLLIIGFIIMGNLAYFAERSSQTRR